VSRIVYRITDQFQLVVRTGTSSLQLEWREAGKPVRRSTGCADLEDAKRRARELILEHAEIRSADPADACLTDVLDRHYLRYAKLLASGQSYRASYKLWSEFFGNDTVAQLIPSRQRQFKAWLEKRGLSANYVRRVIGDGKAGLNMAWQEGEIQRVPFIALPPIGGGYPHWANFEQLVQFLNTPMPDHVFTYCMIRLNTGCRGDAARDLQPFQIDWQSGLVNLNQTGRTQTKKFRPVVPLTDFLRGYLQRQPVCDRYVHWNGAHIKSIKTTWRHVRAASGLPVWFIPKILRHTVGTELRRRGVPGWDISGQLGHKKGESAPTTENYAKFDPAYMSAAKQGFETWMRELSAEVPRMRDDTAMTRACEGSLSDPTERPVKQGLRVVGGTGFEPVTPTMSR
jgi:integrase